MKRLTERLKKKQQKKQKKKKKKKRKKENNQITKNEKKSILYRTDLWLPRRREEGEGWTGRLGLVGANYYI